MEPVIATPQSNYIIPNLLILEADVTVFLGIIRTYSLSNNVYVGQPVGMMSVRVRHIFISDVGIRLHFGIPVLAPFREWMLQPRQRGVVKYMREQRYDNGFDGLELLSQTHEEVGGVRCQNIYGQDLRVSRVEHSRKYCYGLRNNASHIASTSEILSL